MDASLAGWPLFLKAVAAACWLYVVRPSAHLRAVVGMKVVVGGGGGSGTREEKEEGVKREGVACPVVRGNYPAACVVAVAVGVTATLRLMTVVRKVGVVGGG